MTGEIIYHWNSYLDEFPSERKDVYFQEEYVKLYETDDEKAACFFFEEGNKQFLFPFLKREFYYDGKTYFDFETPYGYGGPITNVKDECFIKVGLLSFFEWCKENNFVAGFVRFHPLLDNCWHYNLIGEVIKDRLTVAMDLTLSENDIWMHELSTKNRNVIKKSIKQGAKFIVDKSFNYLDDFILLYNKTMQKLRADDFYFFNPEYYTQLKNNIRDSFLGIILYEKKVISAAIFFSGQYGHYHLSGSEENYLYLCPNNLLLYEAAKEMKLFGVKKFHLGGGISSCDNDSLLAFKSKFSANKYTFSIGKTIFNKELYQDICNQWELNNPCQKEKYKNRILKYKY